MREEREQLAQALHDNIMQMLYATGLLLEISEREVRSSPEQVEDRIRAVIAQLRTIMADVRTYITGSDLPRLQVADLEASLRQLIATLARTGLMRLDLEMDPHVLTYLLPGDIPHLYYIIEEALSNSLRHSKGQRALVSLRPHEDRICLKIEDDGQGFAVSAGLRSGRGLSNMQARAEKLGGTLRVEAVPGRGTQVRLDIPIRACRVTPSPDSRRHLEGGP